MVVYAGIEDCGIQESHKLLLRVVDTGLGVPKDRESLLFQPFSQLASDPKRKEGGTGLGLVISQKLIKLLGGDIGYHPGKSGGSEFWFTVPLRPPTDISNPGVRDSLEGKRILVVSRCEEMSLILTKQLSLKKCLVNIVTRLHELAQLPKFVGNDFDLLIIDSPRDGDDWRPIVTSFRSAFGQSTPILLLNGSPESLVQVDAMSAKVSSISRSPLRQSILYGYVADLTKAPWQEDFISQETDRQARISREFGRYKVKAKRILVAEDNAINQRVAVSMLERIGVECDAVSDGREAVTAANMFQYDAILMDCRMPVLDGFEAAREIRKISDYYKRIPIIAVTANATRSDVQNSKEASMNGFLSKPIALSDLWAALVDHLGVAEFPSSTIMKLRTHGERAGSGINLSVINSLKSVSTKLGNNLLDEVIDLFISNTPLLLIELKRAVVENDSKSVEAIAHKIKGSARNIGATSLSEQCTKLEEMGELGTLVGSIEILEALESEYDRAASYLKSEYTSATDGTALS